MARNFRFVRSRSCPATVAVALMLASSGGARGQCTIAWDPGFPGSAPNQGVWAVAVADIDPGPSPASLFVGGSFSSLGATPANRIGEWDGQRWIPLGSGITGQSTVVAAIAAYDADGAGPQLPVLVAAGQFATAGGAPANSIAEWTGTQWLPLGSGLTGAVNGQTFVYALETFEDGPPGSGRRSLYAGGAFTTAGGHPASCIARWDGSAWSAVGSGVSGQTPWVRAMKRFDPDGAGPLPAALYVGGHVSSAGGASTGTIARWNGSAWSSLGQSPNGPVEAMTLFDADGPGSQPARLVVGGNFSTVGTSALVGVARYDGAAWSPVGPTNSLFNTRNVQALAAYNDGSWGPDVPTLYAGGDFTNGVSRLTPAGWVTLDSGLSNVPLRSMAPYDPDGSGPEPERLVLGGDIQTWGEEGYALLTWNGSRWSTIGNGRRARALLGADLGDGPRVYAGQVRGVGAWDGARWSPVGPAFNNNCEIDALAVFDHGTGPHLFAGGSYFVVGGVEVGPLGEWDGAHWGSVGPFAGSFPYVYAMTVYDDDGNGPRPPALYVGGSFTGAGGLPAAHVARWDGSSWEPLGSGTNASVFTLTVFDDDGPGPHRPTLVAGGDFSTAGDLPAQHIAQWDGQAWSPIGSGLGQRANCAISYDPDGDGPGVPLLVVSADWPNVLQYWRMDHWAPIGGLSPYPAYVVSMAIMDEDGDGPGRPGLFVGGGFTTAAGRTVNNIARWDGQLWTPLTSGTDAPVAALCGYGGLGSPSLFAAGQFSTAGGLPSGGFARWGCLDCYANCDGSTGDPVLDVNDLLCFMERFSNGRAYANCDGSTTPPVLNVVDFVCFMNQFAAGCN